MKRLILSLLSVLCIGALANAAEEVSVVLTKDNTISLNDEFDSHSVAQLAKQARDLDSRLPSKDPIYLVINSPGGSIEDGLELINNLSNLKRPVITINLFSASMGFQTAQALGDRLITKTGTLMSHRATGGFYGQMPGSLGTRYAFYLKRVLKLDENAVRRSNGKLTKQSYATLIQDEFWCEGQDCIDQGVADKIVNPSCDKSLSGSNTVSILQALISGLVVEVTAEYENCPLNTNVLKYVLLVNGEPLFKDGVSLQELRRLLGEQENKDKAKYGGGVMSSLYSAYDSYTTPHTILDSITKEQLTEIYTKVQELIKKKGNKEVVKGY